MTKRPLRLFSILLLTLFLFIYDPAAAAPGDQTGSTVETDMSTVSGDEEEGESTEAAPGEEDLSTVNWDEASDTEESAVSGWQDEEDTVETAEDKAMQVLRMAEIEALESRERLIHISGFILFIGYIIGGVLTAFITRNRRIALDFPPELLILLHTLWPLELLLLPFFGKSAR